MCMCAYGLTDKNILTNYNQFVFGKHHLQLMKSKYRKGVMFGFTIIKPKHIFHIDRYLCMYIYTYIHSIFVCGKYYICYIINLASSCLGVYCLSV